MSRTKVFRTRALLLVGLAFSAALTAGCDTQAFCFDECADGSTGTQGQGGGGTGGENQGGGFTTGSFATSSSTTGGGGCEPTNGGIEICDQVDNDCNDLVDDLLDLDLDAAKSCGTCDNNCFTKLVNYDVDTITCTPSDDPGVTPGTCAGECADDFFDLDADPTRCEYFCTQTAEDDALCNAKDDDCDGLIDEDVDRCTSETDCGQCGRSCEGRPNVATAQCNQTDSAATCTAANTTCAVIDCATGFVDLDGSFANGCEYACTPSGPEVCGDNVDNDCDGLLDSADDLSGDTAIDVVCYGDPRGLCGTPAHAGVTACVDNQVKCTGANVLLPGEAPEVCNGVDDDCDDIADAADATIDEGGACPGGNATPPCLPGTQVCNGSTLVCVGQVNPQTEVCNGVDDNCDGTPDNGVVFTPSTCNVPPAAPNGMTSPCMGGTLACVNAAAVCQNSTGPTSTTDACGVDANCNGIDEDPTETATDPSNCGSCGNNCATGTNATYTCSASTCAFQACLPGYFDRTLPPDGICETTCTYVSPVEACNGQDDDCDGQIDEGITVTPSPVSVCGVNPNASSDECTVDVEVECDQGAWQCTFPMGVGPTVPEACDGFDNDCDGFTDENVPDVGDPCVSDEGLPFPGHGACRTAGIKICDGPNATQCTAMKASCSSLSEGCEESCDGEDNDCDGSVDEPFSQPGTDPTYFVKPAVSKVSVVDNDPNPIWMYQYEASRPTASATTSGIGNGYWDTAPLNTTLDRTVACSVPGNVPWFNITPDEVEQTCQAMGGFICSTQQWKNACRIAPGSGADCTYGYGPYGASCRTAAGTSATTEFCNMAVSAVDINPSEPGVQMGILPTASALLTLCYAEWANLTHGTGFRSTNIFDVTGNVREITRTAAGDYRLMGGAYTTQTEAGATCTFDFYSVPETFKFQDTGFRCCFSEDPTIAQ